MSNSKLKALKDFSASHGIESVSNDYSPNEYSNFLQPLYPSQETRVKGFYVSYDTLLKTFGKPPKKTSAIRGFSDTDWVWLITFKDGAKASVSAIKEPGPLGINADKDLEQITYWIVSGMDPYDYVARLKQVIKEKGGKLLKEDKLKGFKSFYNRYKISKISDMKGIPDNDYSLVGQFFKDYNEMVQIFGKPFIEKFTGGKHYSSFAWVITFVDGVHMFILSNYLPNNVIQDYLKTGEVSKSNITAHLTDKWSVYGYFDNKEEKEDLTDRLKFILGQTKVNSEVIPWTRRMEESSKLEGLKSFINSDQIINARKKAPIIKTLDQLETLPDKSIIWYPYHDVDVGVYITKDILTDYIKFEKEFYAKTNLPSSKAIIDLPEELQNRIRQTAKEFNSTLEIRNDKVLPFLDGADDAMFFGFEDNEDSLEDYDETFIKFVTKAIQQGYKFYNVSYAGKDDPRNIRFWWRLWD
jgi:hypothetical protein